MMSDIEKKLVLNGLPRRETIIFNRLLQGPSDRRDLARLISGQPEYSKSWITQVSHYVARLRPRLEALGYTIPRNVGGNAHINHPVQIIKLP